MNSSRYQMDSRFSIHRFTIIEMLVVISIMATLMTIASSGILSAKKAMINKYSQITTMNESILNEVRKDETKEKKEQENLEIGAAPGSLKKLKTSSKPNPGETPAVQNAKKQSSKQGIIKGEKAVSAVSRSNEEEETDQPSLGFRPREAKVTVVDPRDLEAEPFAEFLFQKGSRSSMQDFQKQWTKKRENLEIGCAVKEQKNPDITLLEQYFLRETVYKSSPYRTYVLRKRLLLASRDTLDEKAAEEKYRKEAIQKFTLIHNGEKIEYLQDGIREVGVYTRSLRRGKIKINGRVTDQTVIPEEVRWRVDAGLLKKKQDSYVQEKIAEERDALEKEQNAYIEQILHDEFPMLQNDKNMEKIR